MGLPLKLHSSQGRPNVGLPLKLHSSQGLFFPKTAILVQRERFLIAENTCENFFPRFARTDRRFAPLRYDWAVPLLLCRCRTWIALKFEHRLFRGFFQMGKVPAYRLQRISGVSITSVKLHPQEVLAAKIKAGCYFFRMKFYATARDTYSNSII